LNQQKGSDLGDKLRIDYLNQ